MQELGTVPCFQLIGMLWLSWICFAMSVLGYLLMQIG